MAKCFTQVWWKVIYRPIALLNSWHQSCTTLRHTATHFNTLDPNTACSYIRVLQARLRRCNRACANLNCVMRMAGALLFWQPPSVASSRGGNTHLPSQGDFMFIWIASLEWLAPVYSYILCWGLVCGNVLQCVAVWCSVLQCVTVCCRVLQCFKGLVCCCVLQNVAVCCSVSQWGSPVVLGSRDWIHVAEMLSHVFFLFCAQIPDLVSNVCGLSFLRAWWWTHCARNDDMTLSFFLSTHLSHETWLSLKRMKGTWLNERSGTWLPLERSDLSVERSQRDQFSSHLHCSVGRPTR